MVYLRKNRGTNYNDKEKSILIRIIQKKKEAYFKGDFNQNKNLRKCEWESIYREFIYECGGKSDRTLRQIKIFWKNYCAKLKREEKVKHLTNDMSYYANPYMYGPNPSNNFYHRDECDHGCCYSCSMYQNAKTNHSYHPPPLVPRYTANDLYCRILDLYNLSYELSGILYRLKTA